MSDEDLERDGIRPEVTLRSVVEVRIERPQAPMRVFHDDGTVMAWFDFMQENRIYPAVRGGASGPGFYVGYFSPDDMPAICAWFDERGFDL